MNIPFDIIPSDAGTSVFDVVKDLSTLNQQAIVRPSNPADGVSGFLFDITGDESFDLQSDITDHYVEGNYAIQDQIALKPETFTVRGMVAELVNLVPTNTRQAPTYDPLPPIPDMLPTLSPEAEETQTNSVADTELEETAIADTQSLYGLYEGLGVQGRIGTRQSRAFGYFYQLWKGRQLCTVETPWGLMTDMAILSVKFDQSEETKFKTDITVTFKKLRFARTTTVSVGELAGRLSFQKAEVAENGKVSAKELGANTSKVLARLGGLSGIPKGTFAPAVGP